MKAPFANRAVRHMRSLVRWFLPWASSDSDSKEHFLALSVVWLGIAILSLPFSGLVIARALLELYLILLAVIGGWHVFIVLFSLLVILANTSRSDESGWCTWWREEKALWISLGSQPFFPLYIQRREADKRAIAYWQKKGHTRREAKKLARLNFM